ncbi:hypothetical protein [Paraburkholderia sp. BL10I2N1]|uniref:hypothetical protein n=1 Tax=Paraburkholderia sp. BL10I2N1 TaxID=1938796 RepID=UPI00105E2F6A|nr:hypothetical protein [Paraburkholderia sp. BL10I2N1]TDN62228.1 hypothetical protein B0G77_5771 [Paraburkholderia sp. BL10I2N1]
MTFDDFLEGHRLAGVSLGDGMLERVRLARSAFDNERLDGLGRWVHEVQARRDDAPELHQLMLAHASFRAIALIIEISVTQGRLADAVAMLESDGLLDNATRMLAHALSCFEKCQDVGATLAFTPASHGLIH